MLVGKNISLRSLINSDLDFLEKVENNESLWKYGSEKKFTLEKNSNLISKIHIRPLHIAKQYRYVIEYKTIPVGFIDLFNLIEKEVYIGIIIDEEYQNRGFTKESLSLLTDYCFVYLDITKLNVVLMYQIKSNNLFLSSGFQFISKEDNLNFYIFVG